MRVRYTAIRRVEHAAIIADEYKVAVGGMKSDGVLVGVDARRASADASPGGAAARSAPQVHFTE